MRRSLSLCLVRWGKRRERRGEGGERRGEGRGEEEEEEGGEREGEGEGEGFSPFIPLSALSIVSTIPSSPVVRYSNKAQQREISTKEEREEEEEEER